ncbi:exodeoxyribonuclease VII small subunit [Neomicrococcus aestuarii]|uniref:Exodeoxyribonuclease 7 small subunit n=1 Tax=Neomicrococcus aestuarii TaxID=556325 RepID=A0A7W8TVL6_9MICC|nr:exodeoxyribonuclease VII small subunit [Neomicrococcus aestuarii]MBB5513623.1 exodeoxyribonuclease VII small subunit [Neomicrococcus aestuarii]
MATNASEASNTHPDIASLSYEQAREELVAVVSQLEAGGTSLEQSLALWERGEALAQRCEAWLAGAQERIDRARQANSDAEDSES